MRPRHLIPVLAVALVCASATGGCSMAETIQRYDLESPPPELGRSDWVRNTAGVGAWVGGLAGGVVAVALLPITYPVRLIRGEPLANDQDLLFPVNIGAATGHFTLGAPADLVDYLFHRAWVEPETIRERAEPRH